MTPVEVKIMLLKRGLTFTAMAKELEPDSEASQRSLQVMIADLLYGRRWYPSLAMTIQEKWGIKIKQPSHSIAIRDQIRRAA